jgi:predicted nucleic acid-binding protein
LTTVVLDAGFFVALARRDHVATELLARTKDSKAVVLAASTITEFWRTHRGLAETRLSILRPTVVDVDSRLAKRAGELLKATRGRNAMDAIVVALAERLRAAEIYTSDVDDIERLLDVAARWHCEAVAI